MSEFGLLNIDKPLGITSHDVVDVVRKKTGIRKIGHAGTLDPLATGVLVICVGSATRLSEYIMGHTKTYRAEVKLGEVTNTYDGEGEVTASNPTPISAEQLEAVLSDFRGHIQQVPPMYSAIKKGGEKLYEKARRGEEIELEPRDVTIYRLSVEGFDYPNATILVRCSSGTYIRSLAHDIGQKLGIGAHLAGLRRVSSGENFTVDNAIPLDDFKNADNWQDHLMSVRMGLSHMPYIELNNQLEAVVRNGGAIRLGISNRGLIQGWTDEGLFVGVLAREADQDDDEQALWKPEKVFNISDEDES